MNIDLDTEDLIESVRPEMAIRPARKEPEQAAVQPPIIKEDNRLKTRSPAPKTAKPALIDEYQQQFVRKSDFNVHMGKTCYVRRKYHERISQIAEMLGDTRTAPRRARVRNCRTWAAAEGRSWW